MAKSTVAGAKESIVGQEQGSVKPLLDNIKDASKQKLGTMRNSINAADRTVINMMNSAGNSLSDTEKYIEEKIGEATPEFSNALSGIAEKSKSFVENKVNEQKESAYGDAEKSNGCKVKDNVCKVKHAASGVAEKSKPFLENSVKEKAHEVTDTVVGYAKKSKSLLGNKLKETQEAAKSLFDESKSSKDE